MQSLVSIIIPCYDAERWIGQCIESCLAQTHDNIEIVVVDDGSTDRSIQRILQYHDHVHLHRLLHAGAASARNHGLRHSTGEYVQFLDADDVLDAGKIASQLDVLSNTDFDVIYGDWCTFTRDPAIDRSETIVSRQYQDYLKIFLEDESRTFIPPGAFLYRREIIEAIGGWDAEIDTEDDHYLNILLALHGARFAYRPGGLFCYRRNHQPGMSGWAQLADRRSAALSSITRLHEKTRSELERRGKLTPGHAASLASRFESLARQWSIVEPGHAVRVRDYAGELRGRHRSGETGHVEADAPDKLMIVAHPDDETLFGGAQLLSERGWKVVCITNAADARRRHEFAKVMGEYGHVYEMWNYPDDPCRCFDCDALRADLGRVLHECEWVKVVTHNAEGEYGHPHHVATHRIVSALSDERMRVFAFDGEEMEDGLWARKLEILGIYESQKHVVGEHVSMARHESLATRPTIPGARCAARID